MTKNSINGNTSYLEVSAIVKDNISSSPVFRVLSKTVGAANTLKVADMYKVTHDGKTNTTYYPRIEPTGRWCGGYQACKYSADGFTINTYGIEEGHGGSKKFCAFFGGHLIKGMPKHVFLLKNELEAMLLAAIYPRNTFLAVGYGQQLSTVLLRLLGACNIVLIPTSGRQLEQWLQFEGGKVDICAALAKCNKRDAYNKILSQWRKKL